MAGTCAFGVLRIRCAAAVFVTAALLLWAAREFSRTGVSPVRAGLKIRVGKMNSE